MGISDKSLTTTESPFSQQKIRHPVGTLPKFSENRFYFLNIRFS
ncbi:hypothetical protein LEP1GSC052_1445 [Leptospira kmetyi serovar Malaysia str. Bejo-Iso9]|nr:hypothetical protein LEP1GSC052_1445 [Leptospira kmetyi serovar Malaysia str. Bejo-Iso9]